MAFTAMQAQVTNRAILLEPSGSVDCGQVPALDGLSSYTVQFWINPTQWTPGATVLSCGDNFSVELGSVGEIVFTVGTQSVTAKSADLKAGEWNGVMFNCLHKKATAYVNNQEAGSGTLDAVPDTKASLVLGNGLNGKLDEVRLWGASLNSDFDYFTFNTLNKWAPQWDKLLVYYKMDQADDVEVLVDYRNADNADREWNNNGVMSEGVSRVNADNEKMPYLWNAAYTENARFFDRTIPRDQYLLSNAVIILGANCNATTGEVTPRTPNNHATEVTSKHLMEFEGRDGVMSFDGTQRMVLPGAVLLNPKTYSFETWIYLDEWTPGAYLFRRETDDQKQGIAVYLGDNESKRVFIRVNGMLFCSTANLLPVGEWVHFGFTTGSGGNNTQAYKFWVNEANSNCDRNGVEASIRGVDTEFVCEDDTPVYLGEGLKAKIDETAFWVTVASVTSHMNNFPLPRLDKNSTVADMGNCKAAYMFDDPTTPGFSYVSQDNWLRIMKGAYDGYAGAQFYLSVAGSTNAKPSWTQIIKSENLRKKFAQTLAELSTLYDGVELDLEWVENPTDWRTYSLLSDEIVAALPEGKQFRVSTHQYSYSYPTDKMGEVDGFTFQQYGPQNNWFGFNVFKNGVNAFINYGYPKDKIVTSYSTTTSKGTNGSDIKGVRDNFITDDYELTNADKEYKTINGENFYFMGPMQVYNRAKFTRENNLQGIFYWDMGNDYWHGTPAEPEMPKYNSAKYCSYGINANVDSIMTGAKAVHYDATIHGDPEGVADAVVENGPEVTVSPSPATDYAKISLGNGLEVAEVTVYALDGAAVLREAGDDTINVANLHPGLYLINVKDIAGHFHKSKFTVR